MLPTLSLQESRTRNRNPPPPSINGSHPTNGFSLPADTSTKSPPKEWNSHHTRSTPVGYIPVGQARGPGPERAPSRVCITCRVRSFLFCKTLDATPFSSEYFDTPDKKPPIIASTVAFALSSPFSMPQGYLPSAAVPPIIHGRRITTRRHERQPIKKATRFYNPSELAFTEVSQCELLHGGGVSYGILRVCTVWLRRSGYSSDYVGS